jgi:hypothetical protein
MRALEILREWTDIDDGIHKELKAKGYQFLGQGVDQAAFLEPGSGLVLKIFGAEGGYGSEDHKMLFFWAKFCEKNSSNPYLPKFYGVKEFYYNGEKYLQFRQERLFKNPKFNERITQSLVQAVDYDDSFKEWKRQIEGYAGGNAVFKDGEPFYKKTASFFGDTEQTQQLKDFFKTVKTLYKICEKKGWNFDCHEGNIMMRQDTTPVITDPWVV